MGSGGRLRPTTRRSRGFLVEAGIDSMSVGPGTFLVKRHVAAAGGHARVQTD